MMNEQEKRSEIVNFRATRSESALIAGAARAAGADSKSAWARQVLLDAAREEFRSMIRAASERADALERQPEEIRA